MLLTRLTPASIRALRAKAGVSQAAVARATGVNRSYLSLFESGRYVLPDSDLIALQAFFAQLGVLPVAEAGDAPEKPEAGFVQATGKTAQVAAPTEKAARTVQAMPQRHTLDGFEYAEAWTQADAEKLMERYHQNEQQLESLLAAEYRPAFFADESEQERAASLLLAQNALFVRTLRGMPLPTQTERGSKSVAAVLMARMKMDLPQMSETSR